MEEKEILIQKIKPEITECRILQIEDQDNESSEEETNCCTKQ